jgi:hypothetical protein
MLCQDISFKLLSWMIKIRQCVCARYLISPMPCMRHMEKCGGARGTTDDVIRCMRFERWIIKTTHTHTEYVILIVFVRQQCLH